MNTIDDSLARRNAVVLAMGGALAGANASVVFATGALVGQAIGPSANWATAPTTTFVIGLALGTIPTALMIRAFGRRPTYQLGAGIGVLAGLLAAYSIREGMFVLFMVATLLCGLYQSCVASYRFGATDDASAALRPKLVAWVLAGGVASAFVGPQLVIFTKDMSPPHTFMYSYIAQAGAALVAILVLFAFRASPPRAAGSAPPARPLREIMKNTRLRVAIICGAISQALMNFIMTGTPLAMIGCNHSTTDAALAIQWHIVGMFLPGFFTGHLIARFGTLPIMALGMVLMSICGIIGLSGISIAHFNSALIMLGIGWNFAFIGASALVAEGQNPNERNTIQGFMDLVIFSVTAVASLTSGTVWAMFGWNALNITLFPVLALGFVMIFWLWQRDRRAALVR